MKLLQQLANWAHRKNLTTQTNHLISRLDDVMNRLDVRHIQLKREEKELIRIAQEDVATAYDEVKEIKTKLIDVLRKAEKYDVEVERLRQKLEILEGTVIPTLTHAHDCALERIKADHATEVRRRVGGNGQVPIVTEYEE